LCALYKAYNGERAWIDIRDRLQAPYYLSRVDHFRKLRAGMTRTDVGKFFVVVVVVANRTIA
jgi:hypothetical protein